MKTSIVVGFLLGNIGSIPSRTVCIVRLTIKIACVTKYLDHCAKNVFQLCEQIHFLNLSLQKYFFFFRITSEISWKEEKQLSYSYWKQFMNPITGVPEHIYFSKYFLSHAEYFITSRPLYSYLFQDGLGILCPVKIILIPTIIMLHIIKKKSYFSEEEKKKILNMKNSC